MPSDEDVIQRAGSGRAMTGVTEPEFTALLPHFAPACVTSMQDHTIAGQPRTSRRSSTYETCPLPTIADKLLFMLTSVKQHPIQEVQGQLFGMSQSHANTWMHLLHTVLNLALAHQNWLPARTADELAILLATTQAKDRPTSPLLGMMVWGEGGELTSPEKATNRAISSISIRIEQAIGRGKRDRMVQDKIRLLKDGIRDIIMETYCGLHNFRLQYRPWNYAT
jgi:Helix-turn-helix of DDE superfamily endonuclease